MEKIFKLVKTGSLAEIKLYLESLDKEILRKTVKYKDDEKVSLIMLACKRGDLDIFNYLIKNKAPFKGSDKNKNSSLHYAMDGNNIDIIKFLISKKIKVEQLNKQSKPAILYLNKDTSIEIIKLLTDKFDTKYEVRANVLYRTKYFNKKELYFYAITSGNLEVLKFLVGLGINVLKPIVSYHEQTWKEGTTEEKSILYYALHSQQIEIAKYLISLGVDKTLSEDSLEKVFEVAVRGTYGSFIRNNEVANTKLIKYLIEELKIPNVDKIIVSSFDRLNPFLYAIDRSQLDLVKYLSKNKTLLNSTDDRDRDGIYYALKSGNIEILDYLLNIEYKEIKYNFNKKLKNYMEKLNNYHFNDLKEISINIIAYLNKKGIKLDISKFDLNSILSSTYWRDSAEEIEMIIDIFKLDIDKIIDGYNLFTRAVSNNKINIAKKLVELGADINLKFKGDKVIHYCYSYNGDDDYTTILNFLIENEVDIREVNSKKRDLLFLALSVNDINIARILIDKEVIITFTIEDLINNNFSNPTLEIIKLLIDNGATLNNSSYKDKLLKTIKNADAFIYFVKFFNVDLLSYTQEDKDILVRQAIKAENIELFKYFLDTDLTDFKNSYYINLAKEVKNKPIIKALDEKILSYEDIKDVESDKKVDSRILSKADVAKIFPKSLEDGCCPDYDHDIILGLAQGTVLEQKEVDNIIKTHKKYKGSGNWQVFSLSEGSGLMLTMLTDDAENNAADFTKKTIKKGVRIKGKLNNSNFTNAILRDVDFTSCKLSGSIFLDSFIEGSNFSNTDLSYVDFSRSDLSNCNFDGANLNNTDFENCNLTNTIFTNCKNLETAMFPGAILENVAYDKEEDLLLNFKIEWINPNKLPKLYYKENNEELSLNSVLSLINLAEKQESNNTKLKKDLINNVNSITKESILELFKYLYRFASNKKTDFWIYYVIFSLAEDDNSIFKVIEEYIYDLGSNSYYYMQNLLITSLYKIKNPESLKLVYKLTKSKKKSVKRSAIEAFRSAAYSKGISVDELKDSFISDFGFNKNREIFLDYGSRTILVKLNPDFKLTFTDESTKKIYKSFPKATKKDTEKVEESIKFIKNMKKEMKKIVSDMKKRLEEEFVVIKLTKFSYWSSIFIKNPVLNIFTTNLFWGVYSNNKLKTIFRYSEDGTFLDIDDNNIKIKNDDLIALIHPVDLTEKELKKVRTIIDDYELIQPINQMDRNIYTTQDELKVLKDFNKKSFSTKSLHYKLTNNGFNRGIIEDNGIYYSYYQNFSNTNVIIKFSGANVDIQYSDETATIKDIIFEINYQESKLKDVSKRLFSEIYKVLNSL